MIKIKDMFIEVSVSNRHLSKNHINAEVSLRFF